SPSRQERERSSRQAPTTNCAEPSPFLASRKQRICAKRSAAGTRDSFPRGEWLPHLTRWNNDRQQRAEDKQQRSVFRPGGVLAEKQHSAEDPDHRNNQHAQREHRDADRRGDLDPRPMRPGKRNEHVIGNAESRLVAHMPQRAEIVEKERANENRYTAEKHDPGGVPPSGHRHRIALLP